jgi:hypothetical protein
MPKYQYPVYRSSVPGFVCGGVREPYKTDSIVFKARRQIIRNVVKIYRPGRYTRSEQYLAALIKFRACGLKSISMRQFYRELKKI